MVRRYRRTCLDAYPLRRERSQGFNANGGLPGNIYSDPFIALPVQFSEGWSEYAAGALQTTAAAVWTATSGTGHGTAQTDGTNIVKAILRAPAGSVTESIVANAPTGTNYVWTGPLRWLFQLSTLSNANSIGFQLGSNQLSYTSGQVNVAGTIFNITNDALLHSFDVQMLAGAGARPAKVFMDGTFLGNSAAFNPSIGAGAVISYSNFFTWNAVNPCYTIGRMIFYANHV